MKILVLGANGMLGSAVFHTLRQNTEFDVWGTLRNQSGLISFPKHMHSNLINSVDVLNHDILVNIFEKHRPNIVINAVGLIKQLSEANDPLSVLPINSLLPHRLTKLCEMLHARLIHISTDCVFSGNKGFYHESDPSDADDLYGKSKFLGEVITSTQAITLRTSIIGHELNSNHALINWFLSQNEPVKGYVNAIYSGLPTVELARIIMDIVIPRSNLSGLFHIASKSISKYDLLRLVAARYDKKITIIPEETICIDRSLNGERFREATGYVAPEWPQLVDMMFRTRNLFGDQ